MIKENKMDNKMIKDLEELKLLLHYKKEEIYLHNEKIFAEMTNAITDMKFRLEDEIAEMMEKLEERQTKYGEVV
jgi:hypothetical protein